MERKVEVAFVDRKCLSKRNGGITDNEIEGATKKKRKNQLYR
jgi:hypothetical protein